jgi:endonuclease/exonuclease/phosphatase family metal-dependent hydrolase
MKFAHGYCLSSITAIAAMFLELTVHAQSLDRYHAFQDPCAMRGNSLRHEKVLNPLPDYRMVCVDSNRISQTLFLPQETITLCNWNVYGLPMQNSGQRQANVADYIAYGCDIFSGQEHWSVFDRGRFRRQARSHFPDWSFKYFGHPVPLHPGSGIMIGSIWPIQKNNYSPWPGGIVRNTGYKGVGYAQITTPRGSLDLYNLHLAAGRSAQLKETQLKHLITFVNQTHDPSLPLVITGDFNFAQSFKLPSQGMNALDWLEQSLGVRPAGFMSRIEFTLISDQVRYIDHRVLADWATPKEVYLSEPFIREWGDHPGIITKIRLNE